MRIGVMSGASPDESRLDELVARAKDLEARGFETVWVASIFELYDWFDPQGRRWRRLNRRQAYLHCSG